MKTATPTKLCSENNLGAETISRVCMSAIGLYVMLSLRIVHHRFCFMHV